MENSLFFLALTGGGLFAIICAFFDFDWFMESWDSKGTVKLLGRDGARVFYIMLGIAVVGGAIWLKSTGQL
jgi:hypothetical protein